MELVQASLEIKSNYDEPFSVSDSECLKAILQSLSGVGAPTYA